MQVTFKRDIIKFEFILINIKIPENSPWTPPTHPSREKKIIPRIPFLDPRTHVLYINCMLCGYVLKEER